MTKDEILRAFERLDALMKASGRTLSVEIAGGAAVVMLHGQRESTKDVDAVAVEGLPRSDWESVVAAVGAELGLPSDWLNARVAAFAMGRSSGEVLFQGVRLLVRSVSSAQLLAMKLSAMRDAIDYADARVVIAGMVGDRETVWRGIEPFLLPGMSDWRRQDFEALWEETHGPA